MKIRLYLLILLLLLVHRIDARVYSLNDIPSPYGKSFVSNPDQIISAATEHEINNILDSLEHHNGVEVAVVLVQSIGFEDIKDFAVRLFNKWGIGKAGADNGLLVLLVTDQRSVTFETGYGIEGDLPDIVCKQLQMDVMVPYFKQGDYNTGMLKGVQAIFEELINGTYAGIKHDAQFDTLIARFFSWPLNSESESESFFLQIAYLVFAGMYMIIFLLGTYTTKNEPLRIYPVFKTASHWALIYLGIGAMLLEDWLNIIPFIFLVAFIFSRVKIFLARRQPIFCPTCQAKMLRVKRVNKANYLEENQDRLHIADCDVWVCGICGYKQIMRYYNYIPEPVKKESKISTTYIGGSSSSTTSTDTDMKKPSVPTTPSRPSSPSVPKITPKPRTWGGGRSGGGGATSRW